MHEVVDKLDDDTLLIMHSDHGSQMDNGAHYTCIDYETCNAMFFAYTKKGFKKE